MSSKIEHAIITMYSRGMSTRDIEETIKDIYGVEVSEGSISNITSAVIEDIKEWQQRPLDPVYFVVWMDGIVIKVRQSGKVIGKTIYLCHPAFQHNHFHTIVLVEVNVHRANGLKQMQMLQAR